MVKLTNNHRDADAHEARYHPVLPDRADLGPAMLKLAPSHRLFVIAFLDTGGRNASKAYLAAGFTGNQDSIKANAWRMLHREDVQAALREEGVKRFHAGAPLAISVIMELIEKDTLAAKDRLRAAELLLNRTGFHAKSEQMVTHTHQLDEAALALKVESLAKELGLDASKLLAGAGVRPSLPAPAAVDVEFSEVSAADGELAELAGII